MILAQTMTAVTVAVESGTSFSTVVAAILGTIMMALAAATPAILASVRSRGEKIASDAKAAAEESKRRQIEAETATLKAKLELDKMTAKANKAEVAVKAAVVSANVALDQMAPEVARLTKNAMKVIAADFGEDAARLVDDTVQQVRQERAAGTTSSANIPKPKL